jgi:hypothetical protein
MIDTPQAAADSAGNFAFFGVPPGSYLLRVVRPETSATTPLLWALENVTVGADADVDALQVSLKGGLRVSGRINVEGSGPKRQRPSNCAASASPRARSPAVRAPSLAVR